VIGQTGETIRWVAHVDGVEIAYGWSLGYNIV
jgi:hypothetical protein